MLHKVVILLTLRLLHILHSGQQEKETKQTSRRHSSCGLNIYLSRYNIILQAYELLMCIHAACGKISPEVIASIVVYPCTLLSAWAGRGQVYGQESGAEDDLVDEATVAQLILQGFLRLLCEEICSYICMYVQL